MLKSFKYRLDLNEEQKTFFNKSFGCARVVYNRCLDRRKELYADNKQTISAYDLINEITLLKNTETYYWLSEVVAQTLQCAVMNLDTAYKQFFNGGFGFPKYKSKYARQSCQFPQNVRINFDNNKVWFPKLGWTRTHISRQFTGKIKTTTVSKNASGYYYVSILVDNSKPLPEKSPVAADTAIGIDVGVKTLATFSDGTKMENPKYYAKSQQRLAILQERLSRKDKNRYPTSTTDKSSKRRVKAKKAVAKQHQKIVNQRTDYLHKQSTRIIRENQTIIIEDLNIAGMTSRVKTKKQDENGAYLPNGQAAKSGLNKAILDVGIGQFFDMLEYKAEWYGRNLIRIGRFEPSSKTCSNCGYVNQALTLKGREWMCPVCGVNHDRDINAAVNVKDMGLKQYYSEMRKEFKLKTGEGIPSVDSSAIDVKSGAKAV